MVAFPIRNFDYRRKKQGCKLEIPFTVSIFPTGILVRVNVMAQCGTLTVVVPVYNEAHTIEQVLSMLDDVELSMNVIVVDDGSSDGTAEILERLRRRMDFELVSHSRNRGKGAALKTGIDLARSELLVVQDGDLEYDPEDYKCLIVPVLSGDADVVFGSRRLGGKTRWARLLTPFYHGVTVLNLLVRILYGQKLTDEATCYKVFKVDDLRRMELECERFEFCPEVTAKACRMGLRIKEVPISYHPRKVSDGKKIGFRDAVEAASTLWKYRKWNPSVARNDLNRHQ